MNFLHIAARIAQQSQTAIPVQHDTSVPLFDDKVYEKDLEKVTDSAKELCDGVTKYLESLLDEMEKDGSVLPEEIEKLRVKQLNHVESICLTLIKKALGVEEADSEEADSEEADSEEDIKDIGEETEESTEDEEETTEKSSEKTSEKTSQFKSSFTPDLAPPSKFAPGKK